MATEKQGPPYRCCTLLIETVVFFKLIFWNLLHLLGQINLIKVKKKKIKTRKQKGTNSLIDYFIRR